MNSGLLIDCALALALVLGREAPSQERARGLEGLRDDAIAGSVIDPEGRPIAGAQISLVAIDNHDGPIEFQQAALHQLRYTPLPAGRTGADGRFDLALTRDQARLGVVGGLQLMLAVAKDGFRSWRGPVGTCPGRVGRISVRLAPSDPQDVIEGTVFVPEGRQRRPAGRIDVVYDARPAWHEGPASPFAVFVGKEAAFAVPRRCAALETSVIWGWTSQLRSEGFHLWPAFEGCAGTPAWFGREAGRCDLRLVAAEDPRARVDVRLAAGAPRPDEATVLYRSQDLGWWRRKMPFAPVPTIGTWSPRAIEAAGCTAALVAADSGDGTLAATLTALPRAAVRLRITGKGGVPVAGAEVEVVELTERTLMSPMAVDAGGRPALRSVSGTDGSVELPAELFARVHYVSVLAAGHAPYRPVELAKCGADPRIELTPIPTGKLRLAVTHDGMAVGGAAVLFGNETYLRASLPGPPATTAADGTLTATLPAGDNLVAVFSEGCAFEVTGCELREGVESELAVKLPKAGRTFVRLVDGIGEPLVRQPVAWRVMTGERVGQPSAYSYTGADGRALLDGVPPDLAAVALLAPGFMSTTSEDHVPRLDSAGVAGEVELAAADAGELSLRLPPGLAELSLRFGFAGKPVRFDAHGAGDFRFPKKADAQRFVVASPLIPVLPQTIAPAEAVTSIDLRMTDWPEVVLDCEIESAGAAALRVVHLTREPKPPGAGASSAGTDIARIWRRPEDGPTRFRFRVPPQGSFDVELQHPRFLAQRLEYVAGKGPQGPVRMKVGSTLKLEFPLPLAGVTQGTEVRGILSADLMREDWEQPEARAIPIGFLATGEARMLEVAWPNALAPGSYTLRITAFPMVRHLPPAQDFSVAGTEPVALELGRRESAPARGR